MSQSEKLIETTLTEMETSLDLLQIYKFAAVQNLFISICEIVEAENNICYKYPMHSVDQ